jgi:hypothetical protein
MARDAFGHSTGMTLPMMADTVVVTALLYPDSTGRSQAQAIYAYCIPKGQREIGRLSFRR